MKLILFVVLYILIVVAKSQYVSFLPHTSDSCAGTPFGVGFVFKLNVCWTNSFNNNYYLQSEDNDILVVKEYDINDIECNGTPTSISQYNSSTTNGNNLACSITPNFIPLNGTIKSIPISYSKVVVSNVPIYSTKSIVYSQFVNDTDCIKNDLLFSISYSNGLTIIENDNENIESETYVCSKNRPGLQYCNYQGVCSTYKIAEHCVFTKKIGYYQNVFCQN